MARLAFHAFSIVQPLWNRRKRLQVTAGEPIGVYASGRIQRAQRQFMYVFVSFTIRSPHAMIYPPQKPLLNPQHLLIPPL